jgi:Secretion system C-terminal sorting domain
MKKTYTLIGSILISGLMFGQNGLKKPSTALQAKYKSSLNQNPSHPNGQHNEESSNREILFESDFSDASLWTISHETGTVGDWVIGNDIPSGTYLIDPINSVTADNGFALFDSDVICSGNQIANLQVSSSIDCSTINDVQVKFSQYYRKFYDSTYVDVSLDGVNWTKYVVNGTVDNNEFSEGSASINPSEVVVNITETAANQSTVYVRFQFYSPEDLLPGFPGCAYSWMIDDVVIERIPDYELKISTYSIGNKYEQLATDLEQTDGPYYQIPVDQATQLKFVAIVSNIGTLATDNVKVEVNVTDYNGNNFGPFLSDLFNLGSFESDTIFIGSNLTPDAVGTISTSATVVYTENAENSLVNNTSLRELKITDNVYALDKGSDFSSAGYNATVDEVVLWNFYEIQSETYCTGLSFAIESQNADEEVDLIGQPILLNILELDAEGNTTPLFDQGDVVHDIVASDFGAGIVTITQNFDEAIILEAGKTYAAELTWFQEGITLRFVHTGSSSTDFNIITINQEIFLGDNYFLRLNTSEDGSIGIKETTQSGNLTLSQNQPNPVRDNTVISYELKNAEIVTLEVYDITGKLISTSNEGTKSAGAYTINYNVSKLNAGIYTYTLVAGDARLTKKMTVIK